MGERTQLFIRIEDEDHNQIAGLVRHYQWGFGRVMVMDALNIAINLPFRSEIAFPEHEIPYYGKNGHQVYHDLVEDKHMIDPILAYEFGKYINTISKSVDNDMSHIGRTLDSYRPQTETFADYNTISIAKQNDMLTQIKAKYDESIENWYAYCDNDDGFMVLTATYNGKKKILANVKNVRFEFFNNQYGKITFHDYCQLNPEFTDSNFEEGFKLIAKNYEFKLD